MPNIFHQSVEDILRAATPEQRIVWNYIYLRYGERCAVSQLQFSGNLIGSELATYAAGKMYFALQLSYSGTPAAAVAPEYLRLYDESNNIKFVISNVLPVWDATAAAMRYLNNMAYINNMLFSRLVMNTNDDISFIGYRLIY